MIRHSSASPRLGWPIRCSLLVAAAGVAGLLGLAKSLEPDARGFGTHTQLGLQPCAFATLTGRLCPSCGMTTSCAWLMRGRIDRSWRANPAGCLLALFSVPFMAWLIVSAVADQPVGFQSLAKPLLNLLVGAAVLALACWLIRWIVSPGVLANPGPSPAAVARATGK
jgi:hypothetical protein